MSYSNQTDFSPERLDGFEDQMQKVPRHERPGFIDSLVSKFLRELRSVDGWLVSSASRVAPRVVNLVRDLDEEIPVVERDNVGHKEITGFKSRFAGPLGKIERMTTPAILDVGDIIRNTDFNGKSDVIKLGVSEGGVSVSKVQSEWPGRREDPILARRKKAEALLAFLNEHIAVDHPCRTHIEGADFEWLMMLDDDNEEQGRERGTRLRDKGRDDAERIKRAVACAMPLKCPSGSPFYDPDSSAFTQLFESSEGGRLNPTEDELKHFVFFFIQKQLVCF